MNRTEKQREYQRKRQARLRAEREAAGVCRQCGVLPVFKWQLCEKHYEASVKYHQKSSRRMYATLREKIFDHYGNVCACCGETESDFLCIDHIEGGGNKHRQEIIEAHNEGRSMYRWLDKMNYPEGFQTLCANCNASKGRKGNICIHELRKRGLTREEFCATLVSVEQE